MPPLDAASQTNKADPSESSGGAPPPDTAPDSAAFDAAAAEARTAAPPPADPSASSPSGQPAGTTPAGQPGAPAPSDPSTSSSGQQPAGTAPSDPSASQTTSEPQGDSSASGVGDAVNGTVRNGTDPLEAIQRLDSTGDTAQFNATAEGKVLVPVPTPRGMVQVGGKGQYGYNISVERTGETGQPPSYDVTFDKRLLAGPQIEIGKGMTPEGTRVGAELNFGTADRVRMQFDNPEDAARAVQLLERTALAETARDAARLTDPSLSNPAGNPLNGSESSDNNAQDDYAPGGDLNPATHLRDFADSVAPSAADQQFLQDHVTGYGQELSGQLRLRAEAKFGQFGLEGRLDGNTRIMREVTLPQDGQPGTLSYSIEGGAELTAKEKVDLTDGLFTGQIFHNNGEFGVVANNVVDIGQVNNRLTLSWDLPDSAFAGGGQPFPDADVLGNEALHPDRVSLSTTAEGTIQNPLDPSRTDLVRGESTISLDNPDHHAMGLINGAMRGDIRGALNGLSQDVEASQTAEIVRRDGSQTQTEIGVKVDGIGEAKGSLILELGNDDVVARATRSTPPPADPTTPTDPKDPADPAQPEQVVVVPHEGLNVRAEPDADAARSGVLSHGTFAQPTGQTATDAGGRNWIEVTSTDTNDRPITGWVAQEYTEPHPEGAMDATGRINPDLQAAGYREVKVAEGDTVWDIAKREGVDFQETVALNQDHLIDPNMIFKGDTVYVPGTGQPPAAEPPAEPPPAPPAQDPSGSSGSQPAPSDPSGSSGSQPAPSDPSGSSGSQPAPSDPSGSSGSQPAPSDPSGSSGSQPAPSDPSGSSGSQPAPSDPSGSSGSQPAPSDPSGSSGSQPAPTNPTDGQPADTAGRPDIAALQDQYRVASDGNELVDFQAKILGIPVPGGSVENITPTEARLLGGLGPLELKGFKDVVDGAREKAAEVYPGDGHPTPPGIGEENRQSWVYNDGHQDAFRHAYWNATMAKHQGAEFAEQYATAHEALPADKVNQTRETMDLYNNEVGRRIQAENPDASDEELATLVQQSIERGEMLVVDQHGNLAWSDQVPVGQHGRAPAGGDRPGGMNVPAGDASES